MKTYSPMFTGKVARCIRDFFMAPATQFCLFCLESEGNPARAVVPDGPVVPVTVEDEHQDIYDTLNSLDKARKRGRGEAVENQRGDSQEVVDLKTAMASQGAPKNLVGASRDIAGPSDQAPPEFENVSKRD